MAHIGGAAADSAGPKEGGRHGFGYAAGEPVRAHSGAGAGRGAGALLAPGAERGVEATKRKADISLTEVGLAPESHERREGFAAEDTGMVVGGFASVEAGNEWMEPAQFEDRLVCVREAGAFLRGDWEAPRRTSIDDAAEPGPSRERIDRLCACRWGSELRLG